VLIPVTIKQGDGVSPQKDTKIAVRCDDPTTVVMPTGLTDKGGKTQIVIQGGDPIINRDSFFVRNVIIESTTDRWAFTQIRIIN